MNFFGLFLTPLCPFSWSLLIGLFFIIALYSFCDYRMQFYRGELKDIPRPIGSPLFIVLKVISLFNLFWLLVNVDDYCTCSTTVTRYPDPRLYNVCK